MEEERKGEETWGVWERMVEEERNGGGDVWSVGEDGGGGEEWGKRRTWEHGRG